MRWIALAALALSLSACSGEGINAGEDGGTAFVALTGMLIGIVVLFWFFLGRED